MVRRTTFSMKIITAEGRVATSGAQSPDVNVALVGTNIVLTCSITTNPIVRNKALKYRTRTRHLI
jgi:hypothetical protein